MKDYRQHFLMFLKKLQNGEHFAFNRFADGEMWILQNRERKIGFDEMINGEERIPGWYLPADLKHFVPGKHEFYRNQLEIAYKHKQPNYYKAIWPPCCAWIHFDWMIDLHGGDDDSLTFSTLWMNSHYDLFVKHVYPIFQKSKCVFIGHESADLSDTPFFVKDFRVGQNAFINDYNKIEDIKSWVRDNNIQDHIFVVSASSFSNLAIYELYKEFPNNTYIDVGTCIAPMVKVYHDRAYLKEYWNGFTETKELEKTCHWK
jgi:hypothetical protein